MEMKMLIFFYLKNKKKKKKMKGEGEVWGFPEIRLPEFLSQRKETVSPHLL
jgi:hypothetical protein